MAKHESKEVTLEEFARGKVVESMQIRGQDLHLGFKGGDELVFRVPGDYDGIAALSPLRVSVSGKVNIDYAEAAKNPEHVVPLRVNELVYGETVRHVNMNGRIATLHLTHGVSVTVDVRSWDSSNLIAMARGFVEFTLVGSRK